jgi:hypothetical protein
MKVLAAAALAGGLMMASTANATVIFFEGFDDYDTSAIAHGATGGTGPLPTTGANAPAATSIGTSGNTISTSYSYRVPGNGNSSSDANSMYDEGTWTIATVPQSVHDQWVSTNDGTPMLLINGATSNGAPLTAYESQGISVHAGTFTYSYDLLNLCCNNTSPQAGVPSILQLWYTAPGGGTSQILINSTVTTDASGFSHVSGTFDVAQPGGVIRLGLVDNSTDAGGNDFGVDNLTLDQTAGSIPEPASWALMMLGFGGLGSVLRSQRRRQAVAA